SECGKFSLLQLFPGECRGLLSRLLQGFKYLKLADAIEVVFSIRREPGSHPSNFLLRRVPFCAVAELGNVGGGIVDQIAFNAVRVVTDVQVADLGCRQRAVIDAGVIDGAAEIIRLPYNILPDQET